MPDHVLTIIRGAPELVEDRLVEEIRAALTRLGGKTGGPNWLDRGIACDVPFADLDPDQADAAARAAIGERPIDVVAQPAAGRRKALLVADMESTLIRNEMLDELADFIGIKPQIAAITARAMNGELDFAEALRARVQLLKGVPVATLEAAAERIEFMPGARCLVATMREHGARTVLVSGGFRYFSRPIGAALGVDFDCANELDIRDGVLTGLVREPILGASAKRAELLRHATELELPLESALAVGDGANDLEMVEAAGLGIAYHAKPALKRRARWRIDHADLTALLYAQGYKKEELAG